MDVKSKDVLRPVTGAVYEPKRRNKQRVEDKTVIHTEGGETNKKTSLTPIIYSICRMMVAIKRQYTSTHSLSAKRYYPVFACRVHGVLDHRGVGIATETYTYMATRSIPKRIFDSLSVRRTYQYVDSSTYNNSV